MFSLRQKNFTVVLVLIAIVLIISGTWFAFTLMQSQQTPQDTPASLTGPIRYNCELSAGTFQSGRCICPVEAELGQTQETQYDKSTGFCQSTIGGPAGDAAYTSSGLPHGDYSFWTGIILNLCVESGGDISGVACICPPGKEYNKVNGKCE